MNHQSQLAKEYEIMARTTKNKSDKICNYSKAISTYRKLGATSDEIRCLKLISELVEDKDKISFLVECWKAYIKEIVAYKYETSYEWKGEDDNLNDDYTQTVDEYLSVATETLMEILRIPGVDRNKLLEELGVECANRENEGGWGSDECWRSIENAWKSNKNSTIF